MKDYLGDDWLLFNDVFEDSPDPLICMSKGIGLGVRPNEKLFAYYNGQKKRLIQIVSFSNGVNRVYNTDKDFYRKVWSGKHPKYPDKRRIVLEITSADKIQAPQEEKQNYIQ